MALRTWLNPFGLDPPHRPQEPTTEPDEAHGRPDLLRWFRRRRRGQRRRNGA
jgi:hypothetical protein